MRLNLLGIVLVVLSLGLLSFGAVARVEVVDLSLPFTCPDVSPAPLRINEKGLVMSGVFYPLVNPNASLSPIITNAVFTGIGGVSEIDVFQHSDGSVDVSYMKYKKRSSGKVRVDSDKIFEKASYSVENQPAYFYSKNQGCRN